MELDPRSARINITGQVQGVGFRPHVFRLASERGLGGFILNSSRGVEIEVSGPHPAVADFISFLKECPPPRSVIENFTVCDIPFREYSNFSIAHSDESAHPAPAAVFVSPDIAVCPDCAADISDSGNRRSAYPFTNCTNCGPRYTITEKLPYDRPYTTMKKFSMCADCAREYSNPLDRRFHAQPNACPECGPGLALVSDMSAAVPGGEASISFSTDTAPLISATVSMIRAGKIAALMGLGGFHIACRCDDDAVMAGLRRRKNRPTKPFALMAPSIERIRELCFVSKEEEELLASHMAPIVLLRRRPESFVSRAVSSLVAPDNDYLGFMLPYTPLHMLIMKEFGAPLVMTSANLSDEPICHTVQGAFERLSGICDLALIHDRDILLPCDDSVAFVERGRIFTVRPSRGMAPVVTQLPAGVAERSGYSGGTRGAVMAVGGILKNTVSFSLGNRIVTSQYIGDTDIVENYELFERTAEHFASLYGLEPGLYAHDMHPGANTTKYCAARTGAPNAANAAGVQHHYAHVLAVMAERGLSKKVLGLAFDGTGYGADERVWGGEFLVCDASNFERAGHFRNFKVQNYDESARDVRRLAYCSALSLCANGAFAAPVFGLEPAAAEVIRKAMDAGVNSVETSSLGRIFDAIAAVAGFDKRVSFEGEAAIWLEMAFPEEYSNFIMDGGMPDGGCYEAVLRDDGGTIVIDWEPLFAGALRDAAEGRGAGLISAKFHIGIVRAAAAAADRIAKARGLKDICLAGGVFFNRVVLRNLIAALEKAGYQVHAPSRLGMGDSGISAGQCYYGIMNYGRI